MATEGHGARMFKNGARPGGVLKHPGKLSDEALEHLKLSWQASHGGENTGGTAILEEGMSYENISMTNEDAQYLDTRQFQRTEICALFRVPPHMIGDLTKSSFSNIEQQALEFVKYSVLPWCKRIETALWHSLLSEKQRQEGYRIEFLVDGLERADIKTRYESYSIAIQNGILSPNECRRLENRNPREGGDVFLQPLNMTDSSQGKGDEEETKALPFLPPWLQARFEPPSVSEEFYDPQITLFQRNQEKRDREIGCTCKAADEEEDDEPEHDDWADGEWSEESADLNQIMRDFRPRLEKMYRQIVAKEVAEIRKLVDKYFPEGKRVKSAVEFLVALQALYARLKPDMDKSGGRLFADLAAVTAAMAAKQCGVEIKPILGVLQDTVADYARIENEKYTGDVVKKLAELVRNDADPREAVLQQLEKWSATRPQRISRLTAVYAANWYARESYRQAGVTQLRWVANGSKRCNLCRKLHGTVVGISKNFVDKNTPVFIGEGRPSYSVRRAKKHPPVHRGCVCAIVPHFEPVAGIERGIPMSASEALKGGNPNFGKDGYNNICPATVFVYEMRRRGYMVAPTSLEGNDTLKELKRNPWSVWFPPDGKDSLPIQKIDSTNTKETLDFLRRHIEPDKRYVLEFFYKKTLKTEVINGVSTVRIVKTGHMVHISKDKNGLKWHDTLIEREYSEGSKEFDEKIAEINYNIDKPELLRVDNLQFNKKIAKAIIQRGEQ